MSLDFKVQDVRNLPFIRETDIPSVERGNHKTKNWDVMKQLMPQSKRICITRCRFDSGKCEQVVLMSRLKRMFL